VENTHRQRRLDRLIVAQRRFFRLLRSLRFCFEAVDFSASVTILPPESL
jgi:hypothetical protein